MATMSITRNITISKEAKRSKVKLPENWIEKYVKK